LAQLKNLKRLNISRNQVGDAGAVALAQLKNLNSLDISHNQVGDAGAVALAKLKNLKLFPDMLPDGFFG
jgi:Leucine-rich repeat (LRR) protein